MPSTKWLVLIAMLALSGCGGVRATERVSRERLSVGDLISRVIGGEEFAGRELVITGIALDATQQGLVNIGTRDTYDSGQFRNFVSVFETQPMIREGSYVRLRVLVEESRAVTIPGREPFIEFNAKFLDLVH